MKKILSLILALALSIPLLGITYATTSSNDLPFDLNELQAVVEQYGFTIIDAGEVDGLGAVASYDNLDEFKEALNDQNIQQNMIISSPSEITSDTQLPEQGIQTFAAADFTGTGNRILGTLAFGLDLCANIEYTYYNVNNRKMFTGFTDFETYFDGFNVGYSFDLLSWYGTPISSWRIENNNHLIYTPTDEAHQYFCTWEGDVKWGVEVGGVLIGVSDYQWGYWVATEV